MTATLGQIRTDVRSRLDEVIPRFWLNTELNTWINESLRDIARRTETLQDFFTSLIISPNAAKYPMPRDVIRVNRVEFCPYGQAQTYMVEAKTYQEMDQVWGSTQTTQRSYPLYYVLWGTPPNLNMQLFPVPSNAGNLNIFYYRLPKTLVNDTDLAELPEGWQDLCSSYCEFMALRKDRDPRWQEAKSLYEETLNHMIDVTRQWHDQAQSFTYGTRMVPNWLYGGDSYGV